jgi:hypothetical protein
MSRLFIMLFKENFKKIRHIPYSNSYAQSFKVTVSRDIPQGTFNVWVDKSRPLEKPLMVFTFFRGCSNFILKYSSLARLKRKPLRLLLFMRYILY